MKRISHFSTASLWRLVILCVTCLAATASAHAQEPAQPLPVSTAPPLFATFDFVGDSVRVFVTDPQTSQNLIDISNGKRGDMIPNGILVDDRPGKSPYDPKWSFHFKPESVQMADFTIEVCDGTASYIEEHMDEWFQGQKEQRWCGWSAKLKKIEPLVYGDVNGDNAVTVADAQGVIGIIVGTKTPTEAERVAADVYPNNGIVPRPGDNQVDLRDAILLLRQAIGLSL